MAKPKKTIPGILVLLFLLILAGAYLRLNGLDRPDFWYDESFSFFMAKKPLPDLIDTLYNGGDAHPFLYYSMLHFWIQISEADWWMRLLSAIFGILAIPAIFFLGKKIFDEKIGLMAAALVAFSRNIIHYAREARMYSLVLLLAVLSIYFFFEMLQRAKKNEWRLDKTALLFIIFNILLVYTHYAAFLLVITEFAVLFLQSKSKRKMLTMGTLFLVGSLLSIVLLINQLNVLVPGTSLVGGAPFDLQNLLNLSEAFLNNSITPLAALAILYLVIIYGLTKKDSTTSALVFLLSLPLGLAFLLSALDLARLINYRYLIATSIPLYLLIAKGVAILSKTKRINQPLATGLLFMVILAPMIILGGLFEFGQDNTAIYSDCIAQTEPTRGHTALVTENLVYFVNFNRYFQGPANELRVLCLENDSSDIRKAWCQNLLFNMGLLPNQIITNASQLPEEFILIDTEGYQNQATEILGKDLKPVETTSCRGFNLVKFKDK